MKAAGAKACRVQHPAHRSEMSFNGTQRICRTKITTRAQDRAQGRAIGRQRIKARHHNRDKPVVAGLVEIFGIEIGENVAVDFMDELAKDIALATTMIVTFRNRQASGLGDINHGDVMPAFIGCQFHGGRDQGIWDILFRRHDCLLIGEGGVF